ncbi:hypothetical protein ABTF68_21790, partial [Acinetobacter baumannii]
MIEISKRKQPPARAGGCLYLGALLPKARSKAKLWFQLRRDIGKLRRDFWARHNNKPGKLHASADAMSALGTG